MSQAHLLALQSFTPLYSFSLAAQSHLHPQACCPTMDIVALVSYKGDMASDASSSSSSDLATVSLWRLSGGSKVWAVDLQGRIQGMVWSCDGLYLAVYVESRLLVLSVHDGAIARDVPVATSAAASAKGKERAVANWETTLSWDEVVVERRERRRAKDRGPEPDSSSKGLKAEGDLAGSVFDMMSALPLVTPLESITAAASSTTAMFTTGLTLQSNKPAAAETPKLHPVLSPSLPRLLHSALPPYPSNPPPFTLLLLNDHLSFIDGSYPTPARLVRPLLSVPSLPTVHEVSLSLARTATAIEELTRAAVEGLDQLRQEWLGKDGEPVKQGPALAIAGTGPAGKVGKEWIAVLDGLATRFGEEIDPVGTLSRLLMTGRAPEALSQFMGGRLTHRSLTKWDGTVTSALTTIRQACHRNICPALERILLLLGEVQGWALWKDQYQSLHIDPATVERAISLAQFAATRVCELEREAHDELKGFSTFIKWLEYEVAIATSSDPDAPRTASHDVLPTLDYIETTLLSSRVDPLLAPLPPRPDPSSRRHPIAIPGPFEADLQNESLGDIIARTIKPFETEWTSRLPPRSPPRSSSSTSGATPRKEGRTPRKTVPAARSRVDADMSDMDQSGVSFSMNVPIVLDGQDAAEVVRPGRDAGLLEIMEELVDTMREVFEGALGRAGPEERHAASRSLDGASMVREWSRKGQDETPPASFVAFLTTAGEAHPRLWIMSRSQPGMLSIVSFNLALALEDDEALSSVEILDLNFFNDSELILVLAVETGGDIKVLLGSIPYPELGYSALEIRHDHPSPVRFALSASERLAAGPTLPLSRARELPALSHLVQPTSPGSPPAISLALNGRPGRMTGTVVGRGGREVEVFDLEEDEGGEEEAEGEEGAEGAEEDGEPRTSMDED